MLVCNSKVKNSFRKWINYIVPPEKKCNGAVRASQGTLAYGQMICRTGNMKTYYRVKEGEKIKYIDVCSLYLWVCKNGKFPIGHPKVRVGTDCLKYVSNLEGLIKCTILAPQNLHHPVLLIKANGKLMFSLCRTCAINQTPGECEHLEGERAFIGTWVIDEVLMALKKGYKLLEVHELWVYNIDQYNPSTKLGGLFSSMIDKFLAGKLKTSGWPKHCLAQKDKELYIEEFLKQEGISLDFAEIVENPGLRALAELMLNSFWGKLGQRENQPKTKIVSRPDVFFNMMSDPSIIVNTVFPINDDNIVVNYKFVEEVCDVLTTVNVCLAAYTTAQAVLKLYTYLEQLGERVLYYDTDSAIYISRESDKDEPKLGNCVGDMTDELSCYGPGSYISEFASGGSKNYAYRCARTILMPGNSNKNLMRSLLMRS